MALTLGTRLGPYEIVAAIGAGGMGEVYRARDTKLDRDVALKVLPDAFAADPDRLARFHREAQVLAALNHPNIAQIYGFEDSGATHALVMELVDGPTLADRIEQGPVPLAEALPIARQIATALEAAHEQGIVHRDLKPANVKVRPDGTVKVLDFGLAKAMDPTSSSDVNVMNSPTLTRADTARHDPRHGRLHGARAGQGQDGRSARGHLGVRRRAVRDAGGRTRVQGRRRLGCARGGAAAGHRLEGAAGGHAGEGPSRARALPRTRSRDAGCATSATCGSAWTRPTNLRWRRPRRRPRGPRPRSRAGCRGRWLSSSRRGASRGPSHDRSEPASQLVTRSTQIMKDLSLFVATSRDGTRIAYAIAGGQNSSAGIVLRMLDQFDGRVVPGTERGAFPLFSPDGQWIAYTDLADQKIKKIPITGGTSITLCDGSLQWGGAWGDDGTIVFRGPKGLMRVPADGGVPESLTTLDSSKGETSHVRPQFLPGGRRLLFTVMTQEGEPQFAVRDLDKTGHRIVAKGGANGQYVASGHLTFVRGTTLFAMPFDLSRLEVTGGEVPVVEDVSVIGPSGHGGLFRLGSRCPGVLLEPGEQPGQRSRGRIAPVRPRCLPGQSRQAWGTGRLSPDGRLVANGISNERSGRDIWTFDVERGTLTRLSFGGQNDTNDFPIWTPDGRRVVYSGIVEGKHGLYACRPMPAPSRR